MNPIDPHDTDELVTAYIDDEATPTERARVEADPSLMARVELLRSVAAMIAEPVDPAPPALRDRHIAAAIAASDTTPTVTSLSLARRARTRRYTAVLGAAAAILVGFLVATVVVTSTDDGGEDLATSVEEDVELEELSNTDSADDADAAVAAAADGEAAGDAAAESGPLQEPAPAEIGEEGAADESADTAADDGLDAAEESSSASDGERAGDLTIADTAIDATTRAGFAAAVLDLVEDDDAAPAPTPGVADRDPVPCEDTLVDISATFGNSVLAGTGTIGGEAVQYVVVDDGEVFVLFLVGAAPSCDLIDEMPLR